MAAPAAAGCTALMQEANATLKSWPEGCRAILLAAASKNVTGSTWWADRSAGVDAKDGAGAVDGLEAVRVAQNRRSPGSAGVRRGWDVGTLRSSDIGAGDETTFSWQVTVPRLLFNARVKVALAWDSFATVIDVLVPADRARLPAGRPRSQGLRRQRHAGRLQRLVGQQLRDRRVRRAPRCDLHDQDPPLVGHRRRLVRGRVERAGHAAHPAQLGPRPDPDRGALPHVVVH